MKREIYLVIAWAIVAFLLLCASASMISMRGTLVNGLGMILAIVTIIMSIETRLFMKFAPKKKQVEDKGKDLCELKDDPDDLHGLGVVSLSDIVEVEPTESEVEVTTSSDVATSEIKKKRKRKRKRKKRNEVQEQVKES